MSIQLIWRPVYPMSCPGSYFRHNEQNFHFSLLF
jgi:hypothetical protein